MTMSNPEHIDALEQRVAEAKEGLHEAIRQDMGDDTITGQIEVLEEAQRDLEQERAKSQKLAQAVAEVAAIDRTEAEARELAMQRRATAKAVKAVNKRYYKVERYADLLIEGYRELIAAADRAYAEAPQCDKPPVGKALYKDRKKLADAIAVKLTEAGLAVLPERPPKSMVRMTPERWAASGGAQIMPKGAQ